MSRGDLAPVGTPTLTEAYQQGRDDERAALLPVLQDLITALQDLNKQCTDPDCACLTGLNLYLVIHRAEARLREVSGDE